MINKERIKKTGSITAKIGVGFGSVVGVFNDFLLPLAPIGIYVAGFSMLALLLCSAVYFIVPQKRMASMGSLFDSDNVSSIWFAPIATTLLVLSIATYSAYIYSSSHGDDGNGVIATVIPEVRQLQQALGILESIDARLGEVVAEQQKTNVTLGSIDQTSQEISRNTGRSVEQQELTNKGVFWNQQTLHDALMRGDLEIIEMFRQQGHDISMINRPASSAPLAEAMIIYAIRNNHHNIDQVLTYLSKHKVLEVDRIYTVTTSMVPQITARWQRMEVSNYRQEYKKQGSSFNEFQKAMEKRDIFIPDDLASEYAKQYGGNFSVGPVFVRTTLLLEAIYANNTKAVEYLVKQRASRLPGYIELSNGARLILHPNRAAAESDSRQIQRLVS